MKRQYGVMLDSGCVFRHFLSRPKARAALVAHNKLAREGKRRGDMVTLRLAVGIVRMTRRL